MQRHDPNQNRDPSPLESRRNPVATAAGQHVAGTLSDDSGGTHSNPDHMDRETQSHPVREAAGQMERENHATDAGRTNKRRGQSSIATQPAHASTADGHCRLDDQSTPAVRETKRRGQDTKATRSGSASTAASQGSHETQTRVAGGTDNPDHPDREDLRSVVGDGTASDHRHNDAQTDFVGSGPFDSIVEDIRGLARERKFWMKVQQKLDRALESFIRVNYTGWSPELPEEELEKYNTEVKSLISAARKGEGDPKIVVMTSMIDHAREPADNSKDAAEKTMTDLAESLPVAGWVHAVHGAGILGLAIILGETGPLDRYANPAKVWKRLGFAPYDGYAGSTWKREKWRPRKLTDDEWVENPFSGKRYAEMATIADSLRRAQWMGKDKDPEHKGKAKGPYGQVYADRKAHTLVEHPEWYQNDKGKDKKDKYGNPMGMHAERDALRYMMKRYLRDLWCAWRDTVKDVQPSDL